MSPLMGQGPVKTVQYVASRKNSINEINHIMLEFVDWFIDKCGNNVSRSDYIEGYDATGNTEKVFKEINKVFQKQASGMVLDPAVLNDFLRRPVLEDSS